MDASTSPTSSLAVADRTSSVLPRLIERVVGDLLELVVHSIEELRDRVAKSAR